MVLEWLPLFCVVIVLSVFVAERFSRRVEVVVTRAAYRVGGTDIRVDEGRRRELCAAGIGTPYRKYASKTYLYALVGGFSGAVVGVYVGAAILQFVGVDQLTAAVPGETATAVPAFLASLTVKQLATLGVSSLCLGLAAAMLVYFVRWSLPGFTADTRRRQIDAGMPRMVAFVYALSRGGMSFPEVMRALSRNRGVFGVGAEEMGVGVRDIDLFGSDVVSAIRGVSRRTPSEPFRKFTENLSSVLQSGRNLSAFLAQEYERYRTEAEERQTEVLELLATTAEVYVTVVVAGMLFLITILLVMGLTTGDTLVLIQLTTYVVLPATNVLFMAYLAGVTQPLRAGRETADGQQVRRRSRRDALVIEPTDRSRADAGVAADGGQLAQTRPRTSDTVNRGRLRAFLSVRRAYRALSSPFESLVTTPEYVLVVTVPLALAFVLVQLPAVLAAGVDVRTLDDAIVQATLFVLATYAVVYEIGRRRLDRLEEGLPDLLERLASLNEAGVSIVSSFDRVRRSDVGSLDAEVERIWRDIRWGATVEQALSRFQRRVRTPAVTRIVTLVNNAMRASNDIGPVLRIAAEQARSDARLKAQRRQTMFSYLVVIYVSFLVFVVVVAAIDTVLVPSLPSAPVADQTRTVSSSLLQVTRRGTDAYRLTFFHAALVQAGLSGLVGGQMGEGSIRDGVKHAAIMLGVTYLVFVLLDGVSVGL